MIRMSMLPVSLLLVVLIVGTILIVEEFVVAVLVLEAEVM